MVKEVSTLSAPKGVSAVGNGLNAPLELLLSELDDSVSELDTVGGNQPHQCDLVEVYEVGLGLVQLVLVVCDEVVSLSPFALSPDP